MHKNIKLQAPSILIKVNNTATKHSLCPGNGVFVHEKITHHIRNFVRFVLTTTKT